MREPSIARDKERGATGVIDTLSAGYATVNRYPWLLAIPLLLDFFFWLGPRLSLAPLLRRAIDGVPAAATLSAEMMESYQLYREELLQAGEGFNLLSLLVTHFPGLPSLMAARGGLGPTSVVDSSAEAIGLSILLPVIGMGLAAIYYTAIGEQIRGGGEDSGRLGSRASRVWLGLLAFVLMALGVILLVAIPTVGLTLLLGAANSSLLGFLASFLMVTAVWIQFYLYFLVDAMVISDVGPVRAIRNSIAVVRFNLGASLALIALVWIITLGMPVVWSALAENPMGVIPSILGNAYIATGLAVASMIFYRDRFAALNRRAAGDER